MPVRIQRRRIKGWRLPDGAVSVTRPSEFGNPYRVTRFKDKWIANGVMFSTEHDAAELVVNMYKLWINSSGQRSLFVRARTDLRGKDLACFCKIGVPCHADVLLAISNESVAA